jgi:teichuronic acid exporter
MAERNIIRESGLGKKVLKSLTWVGSANLLSQILSWAITIFIVRQLSPGDFGLMAMALVFWGFLTMIGDFGLYASIVQSKEVSKNQLRQIYGFIISLNFLFLIATYLCAPMISSYFSEIRLTSILRTLGLAFVLIPLYVIPYSLLLREMSFQKISVIDVFCNLCGATTSLLFVLNDYGVWSLVYGTLVLYLAKAVSINLVARHYYIPLFRTDQIKEMLSFSSFFTGSTILRYFYFKSDIIVGGKFIGADALGIYTIANQLAFLPVDKLSLIIPEVALSAFSKMQFDIKTYSEYFLKGIKLLNLIFVPCYIILFILAGDIVNILLGPKWEKIILPMRILCLIMPFRAFEMLFHPAMNALGKSKITMLASGLSLSILVCCFLFGLKWGYIGLCWAWVGGYSIIYLIMGNMCVRNLQLGKREIARSFKTPIFSSLGGLIMGLLLLYNKELISNSLLKIAAYIVASIILYSISIYFIDKRAFLDLKLMFQKMKSA